MTQNTAGPLVEAKAVAMRLTGIALLWVALSALAFVPTADDVAKATIVAVLGFVSFVTGLSLFADAVKRDIIAKVREGQSG